MNQGFSRRALLKAMGISAGAAWCYSLAPSWALAAEPVIPRRGGILRAAFAGSGSGSPDVLRATNSNVDYVRARLVWDTLADIDDNRIDWRLMTSAHANKDATRWTIKLRRGVTFSDGKPLTAKDVLFSLRTFADQPTSQSGWLKPFDPAASQIEDDHTLTLQLRRSVGSFDWLLAQSMFIFPADTTDFSTAPGSGPYRLHQWSQDKSVLTARQDYWGSAQGGPYLDEIHLFAIGDTGARLNGMKAGQFDYAGGLALLAARSEQQNAAVKLWRAEPSQWSSLSLTMNLSQPPFNRPEVVEALKRGIDRQAMVRAVTYGMGEVANDALGHGQPWFANDLPVRPYDPQQALALLKKSGAVPVKAAIRTSDYEYGTAESATLLLRQAKPAGFELTLNKLPAMDYYSDISTLLNTPLQTNLYRPMPLPVALPFYYGSGASYPFTGPASPQLDRLIDAMQAAQGDAIRGRVQDLQHWLYQHGGDAIFARIPSLAASTPAVQGVKACGFFDYPLLRDAWLSDEK